MPRVAVLCWEECRPWVSALRQSGYSVPWVEEPKGDVHRQIPGIAPDVVVVDCTRRPEQGRSMILALARVDEVKDVPFVIVAQTPSAGRGLKTKVTRLIVTSPDEIVVAVEEALAAKSPAT